MAFVLMLVGIAVLGIITAAVAAWLVRVNGELISRSWRGYTSWRALLWNCGEI